MNLNCFNMTGFSLISCSPQRLVNVAQGGNTEAQWLPLCKIRQFRRILSLFNHMGTSKHGVEICKI